jgi:hypothetical protein
MVEEEVEVAEVGEEVVEGEVEARPTRHRRASRSPLPEAAQRFPDQ